MSRWNECYQSLWCHYRWRRSWKTAEQLQQQQRRWKEDGDDRRRINKHESYVLILSIRQKTTWMWNVGHWPKSSRCLNGPRSGMTIRRRRRSLRRGGARSRSRRLEQFNRSRSMGVERCCSVRFGRRPVWRSMTYYWSPNISWVSISVRWWRVFSSVGLFRFTIGACSYVTQRIWSIGEIHSPSNSCKLFPLRRLSAYHLRLNQIEIPLKKEFHVTKNK